MKSVIIVFLTLLLFVFLGFCWQAKAEDEYVDYGSDSSDSFDSSDSPDSFDTNNVTNYEDVSFDGGGGSTINTEYDTESYQNVPDVGPSGPVGYYDSEGNYHSY